MSIPLPSKDLPTSVQRRPQTLACTLPRETWWQIAHEGRRALVFNSTSNERELEEIAGRLLGVWDDVRAGDWVRIEPKYRSDHDEPILCEVAHVSHSIGMAVLTLGIVGYEPMLEITLPRPTKSLKNSRVLGMRRMVKPGAVVKRVPASRKSPEMLVDLDMVKRHGNLAVGKSRSPARGPRGLPFGDDDAIELRCYHLITEDRMIVRAVRVGFLPEGGKKDGKRGTKRDVHGIVELVADALQGVWWTDDRQIDRASQERVRSLRSQDP